VLLWIKQCYIPKKLYSTEHGIRFEMVQAKYLMENILTGEATEMHQSRDHNQNPQYVKNIATWSHILNQMLLEHFELDETFISNYRPIT
jgi:hypothetical protein